MTQEAEYTRGPWNRGLNNYDNETRAKGNCFVYDFKGRMIANTGSVHRDKNENEANARLIESAPDLLAALQEVLPSITYMTTQDKNWDRYYAVVKAAIDKAK